MENKNQRTMIWLIGIFLFIFVVSIVYAALGGTLQIGGTATFAEVYDVRFAAGPTITSMDGAESIGLDSTGKVMSLELVFDEPGASRTINFSITNPGNVDAEIDGVDITTMEGVDCVFNQSALTNAGTTPITLLKTNTVGPYSMTCTWNIAYDQLIGENPLGGYGEEEPEPLPKYVFATISHSQYFAP